MRRETPTHPMRQWREATGHTLADVAEVVEITSSHLSEIERWRNEPSLALASRLSTYTGIPLYRFVKPEAKV